MHCKSLLLSGVLCASVVILGCQNNNDDKSTKTDMSKQNLTAVAVANIAPSKAATTQPVANDVRGTVTLTQTGNSVKVVADLQGLPPNSKHGIHIHEKADMSAPDLMSTGSHYNPDKHVHGGPATQPVHAGDFGNIQSDANGKARLELTVDNISLGGPNNNVVGLPIIVHAKADDLSSQPSGNSGARIAGGLIQMKK